MRSFDFTRFDALCAETLKTCGANTITDMPQLDPTELATEKPELTDEVLHTTAEWVTRRVLDDMDALLQAG